MVWGTIYIIVLIFFIGALFYKQSVQEFRISQISWDQVDKLQELWEDRVPLVVKGAPVPPVWTFQDVGIRPIYGTIPATKAFAGAQPQSVQTWVAAAEPDAIVPWSADVAARIAEVSNLKPWVEATWAKPCNRGPKKFLAPLFPMVPHLWAGARGMEQVRAQWTAVFPVEGSIVVTLLTTGQDAFLPTPWKGTFPSLYTIQDTPYVGSIKFVDVILRPGHTLFIPSHWKMSWEPTKESLEVGVPFICTLDIHTPWSWLATRAAAAAARPAAPAPAKKKGSKPRRKE
jgi:hypothetical protein